MTETTSDGWGSRYIAPITNTSQRWAGYLTKASAGVARGGVIIILGKRGRGKTRIAAEIRQMNEAIAKAEWLRTDAIADLERQRDEARSTAHLWQDRWMNDTPLEECGGTLMPWMVGWKDSSDNVQGDGSPGMACSPRVLAERIATDLFSNAFGDQGTRLEIKQATAPQSERSLGGWCYVAAVDRITVILEENAHVEGPAVAATQQHPEGN